MLSTPLQQLRLWAILEGISFLLLMGVCMPLKYIWDIPEPTYPIGLAHGVLFVGYCLWVLLVAFQKKWPLLVTGLCLVASLLPFGTFVADAKWFKKQAKG